MTTQDINEADLDSVLRWLGDGRQFHQDKVELYLQGEDAVRHTRQIMRRWRLETAAAGDEENEVTHFGTGASAIVNCPTVKEGLALIACRNNGHLHYRTAARVVLKAGLSKAKSVENLATDILRQLKQSRDWESVSPGVYQYLPYAQRDPDGTRPERAASLVPVSTAHVPASPRPDGGGRARPT